MLILRRTIITQKPRTRGTRALWVAVATVTAVSLLAGPSRADELDWDPTFTSFEFGFDYGGNLDDVANDVAVQADGRIVVAGSIERSATGDWDIALVRLQTDGTIDSTFGFFGVTVIALDRGGDLRDEAWAVAPHGDGLVVGGSVETGSPGGLDMVVCRLDGNGVLDPSFGTNGCSIIPFDHGGGNDDVGFALAVQPDHKVVVAGKVEQLSSGNFDFGVVRLNFNGSLDATFGFGGRWTVPFDLVPGGSDSAHDVVLQPDGRILLVGAAFGGDYDFAVARLTSAGVLDTSFSGNGKRTIAFDIGGNQDDVAYAAALHADGKIVLAGYAADVRPSPTTDDTDYAVVRLLPGGALDTTFAGDGRYSLSLRDDPTFDYFPSDVVRDVGVSPDGRIFLAGYSGVVMTLTLVAAHGDWLRAMGSSSSGEWSYEALAFQPGGELVAAASIEYSNGKDFAVRRFLGLTDPFFADGFDLGSTIAWSMTVGGN